MRLVDLSPTWYNPFPVANGIAMGLKYTCPNNGPKRIHTFLFKPIINPYDEFPGIVSLEDILNQYIKNYMKSVWKRVSGDSFDTLTIDPSIGQVAYWVRGHDKPQCCHINITNGMVIST